MLYSDLGIWLYQQSIETQILVIYLFGFITIGLYLLNYWYEEWTVKRAKKKRIKELEKLFNNENYHII